MTTEEFIQKAKAVHGDKYDYSKVEYVNNYTKVCIICLKHSEFWQQPSHHLRGHGCPKCAEVLNASKLRKWTKELVFEEAHKYSTKRNFYKGNRSAYAVAERNRWFDEMTWFEEPNPNRPRVWTKEAVFALAKTCKTKLELRKANKGAYNVAWKNGWLDEMDWLDTLVHEPYTKEEVLSIARQYNTKNEFRKAAENVYNIAQKKGWLYEITWFITSPKYDKYNYCVYVYTDNDHKVAYVGLTVDKVKRHYSHSTGYNKNGKTSRSPVYRYFQSIDRVVPDPIYLEERLTADEAREKEHEWRMKYQDMGYRLLNIAKTGAGIGSLGGVANKWTKPKVFKEAQKYQSRSEFASNCTGAYAVACKKGWIEQMPWMRAKWSHPTPKWTKEAVFEEAKKYSTRRDFQRKAKVAYSKASKNGWLDEMQWLKITRRVYKTRTKDEIMEISRKFTNRASFARSASSAYNIARREKWLDEMPWLIKQSHGTWTKEDVFEEAKKYSSRKAFRIGNETAYRTALKNHWMDELFPKKPKY